MASAPNTRRAKIGCSLAPRAGDRAIQSERKTLRDAPGAPFHSLGIFMDVASGPPPASDRPRRILIVDDDADRCALFAKVLSHEGYAIDTLAEGTGLVARVRDDPPDLVLLDIMLPEVSGLEICGDLRMLDEARMMPIILVTSAFQDEQSVVQGLLAGADDYIVSPFRLDELRARIRVQLRNRRDREMLQWAGAQGASLKSAAMTDAMTGLANRRAADAQLDRALRRGRPGSRSADRHRPLQGAQRHVRPRDGRSRHRRGGGAIKSRTRRGDLAARYGGDEFLVVVRGAGLDVAARIGQRYLEAIRNIGLPPLTAGQPRAARLLTATIGIAGATGRCPRRPCLAALRGRRRPVRGQACGTGPSVRRHAPRRQTRCPSVTTAAPGQTPLHEQLAERALARHERLADAAARSDRGSEARADAVDGLRRIPRAGRRRRPAPRGPRGLGRELRRLCPCRGGRGSHPFVKRPCASASRRRATCSIRSRIRPSSSMRLGSATRIEATFHHGAAVARMARHFARARGLDADVAFLAGLLHDLGRARCWKLVARRRDGAASFDAAIAAVDDLHCTAGAELASAWRLPEEVVEVCRWHHEPSGRAYPLLVAAGDAIASFDEERGDSGDAQRASARSGATRRPGGRPRGAGIGGSRRLEVTALMGRRSHVALVSGRSD